MIQIKTLSSGSHGNCYYLTKGDSKLLVEAGINPKKINVGTGFNTMKCDGVLISHLHGDHSKFAKKLHEKGLKVFSSKSTLENIGLPAGSILKNNVVSKIGDWEVLPFDVEHDVDEPFGYLIRHEDDYLLFATDTYFIRYLFPETTQFLIECNYCNDILVSNLKNGLIPEIRYKRTLESHFSLENLKKYLEKYDHQKIKEIRLIHLSNDNSDEDRMISEIQKLTGVATYAE